MPAVNVLPFDEKLGYPQKQLVNVNGKAYMLFYRWNYEGNFAVLRIRRVEDDTAVFEGKLTMKNPMEVKDPTTYDTLFTILPWKVDESVAEVWVFA
ncbi:hypothetical protein [Geoglobus acetivorans]|uniref:hypothetical protein n=1 Tax=Geoglobus acetivorans TaxID=565033 RepID=UPI0011DE4DCB